jgi:hypothetical protein
MGPGIDMPRSPLTTLQIGGISPTCVGDQVTILSQQRFDDIENFTPGDHLLGARASIEHLVTKILVIDLCSTFGRLCPIEV